MTQYESRHGILRAVLACSALALTVIAIDPTPQALASLDAFSQWRQAVLGVRSAAVDRDVRAIMTVTSTGVVPRTPGSVMLEVLKGDIAAKPR